MITKFKLFEHVNVNEPKVGDYVIVQEDPNLYKNQTWYDSYLEFINIIKNQIGRIIKIDRFSYIVEYKENSKDFFIKYGDFLVLNTKNQLKCRRVGRNSIIIWANRKKELNNETINMYLKSKKYNIL
jgi:hypothetical protein